MSEGQILEAGEAEGAGGARALAAELGWGPGAGWGAAGPGASSESWWFSGCCRDPGRAWRALSGAWGVGPMGPGEVGEAVAAMAEQGTPVAHPGPRAPHEAVRPGGVTPASLSAAFRLEGGGGGTRTAVLVTRDGAARCVVRGDSAPHALAAVLRALGGPTLEDAVGTWDGFVAWGNGSAGFGLEEVTSVWFWADWTPRQELAALRHGGVFQARDGATLWRASHAQCKLDLSPAGR